MLSKDTFRWFVRGFVLTSLVMLALAALIRPTIGRAQGGGDENPNVDSLVVEEAPPGAASTDDPEGRAPLPVADSSASLSNWEAMLPGDISAHSLESDEARQTKAAGITTQATRLLVIPAADFSSDGFDPGGFFFDFAGGYVDGRNTACLKAPAYLPDGVTVSEMWTSLYDNASGGVVVNLRRVHNYTGVTNVMAAASTSTDSTSIQTPGDSSISFAEVSHPYYSYYVDTCLSSSNHRLYSVRIYYTP